MNSTTSLESPEQQLLEPDLESRKNEIIDELDLETLRADGAFDRAAHAAASACQSSAALVTLVGRDQQYTLGKVGTDLDVIPREESFCTYTIQSDEPVIVPDARSDDRFASSQIVQGPPHLRFYAGARYKGANRTPLGAVCAVDTESPNIDTVAQAALQALASQVERHIMTYLVSSGYALSDQWYEHTQPDNDGEFVRSVEEEARELSRHITEIQADIMMSRFSEDVSETRERMLNWKIDRDVGRAQEKLVGMLESARKQRAEEPGCHVDLVDVVRDLFDDVRGEESVELAVANSRDLWRLFQTVKSLVVSAGALTMGEVDIKRESSEVAVTIEVTGQSGGIDRLSRVASLNDNDLWGDQTGNFEVGSLWQRAQRYARAVEGSLLFLVEEGGDRAEWILRFPLAE